MSEFLIITGMSGAGRSTAADTFEDGGWFVIDNMPPSLIGKVADLVGKARPTSGKVADLVGRNAAAANAAAANGPAASAPAPNASAAPNAPAQETERVALVVGRSSGPSGVDALEDLSTEVASLRQSGHNVRILFLDAADDVLVRRFEGTRRRHPTTAESVTQAIRREREMLDSIKAEADIVVDTTELNVHQLRARLIDLFERDDPTTGMQTTVVSFGYKHGIPLDVDLVFDCRFLPNPHWIDELRPLTGLDDAVRDYVTQQPETAEFLAKLDDMLGLLLPAYVKEGKAYLTVAVGCTGGRHRSVVLADAVARLIEAHGFKPTLLHRDVQR